MTVLTHSPVTKLNAREKAPFLSVILPVFNAGELLHKAWLSVEIQTFGNWELIVIDDGSTDDAWKIFECMDDQRVRFFRDGQNKGLAARLNQGLQLARGQYIARMDQDDICYPERFEKQIEFLHQHPEVDLVSVRCLTISFGDRPIGVLPFQQHHRDLTSKPWRGFLMAHPTWMGKTEWFRRYYYTSPEPYCFEDQELLLRAYSQSVYATLSEVLFAYRIREKKSWKKLCRTRWAAVRTQSRFFLQKSERTYVMLSILMFISRMMMDALNALLPVQLHLGNHRRQHINEFELKRYNAVLKALESKANEHV